MRVFKIKMIFLNFSENLGFVMLRNYIMLRAAKFFLFFYEYSAQ